MKILQVRARTLRLPLERPIRTSNLTIDAREFVLVEIRGENGTVGVGYGFTRHGLVAETIERNLSPILVGSDARLVEHLWERMYLSTRYLGRKGLVMRAISAVDIALWDLKAKAAGLPLWAMLGGYRHEVPAFVAGGYYGSASDPDAVHAEFATYREAGYRGAKINAGGLARGEDLARIEAARSALGDDVPLAVDFNGALDSARDLLSWASDLAPLGIAFIEEPFLMDNRAACRRLGAHSPIRIAMGEDESGRWAFEELLSTHVVEILRHDATLVGGISEWIKVAGLGLARRVEMFPHWFPDVHIHVASALPSCMGVEFIAPDTGVMNLHRVMADPLAPRDGSATPPERPGLGITWNWDAVEDATV